MSRRELREQIFKLIFRAEFYDKEELPEQEKLFFEDYELNMKPEDETYISEKSNKILEKLDEIDGMINQEAKGWTTERMGKIELTILRLAIYEIKFDEDVPAGVAINEAVEIAKEIRTGRICRFCKRRIGEVRVDAGKVRHSYA